MLKKEGLALKGEAVVHHVVVGEERNETVIEVFAGRSKRDNPVFEALPARRMGDGTYELLASPGLALNLAKGDIIKIVEKEKPAEIVRRGGNFCIQIYAEAFSSDVIAELEASLHSELHGSLDGIYQGNLAISVPATAGMQTINEFFDLFAQKTGVQWYYCNIYKNLDDLNDETLSNWWLQ